MKHLVSIAAAGLFAAATIAAAGACGFHGKQHTADISKPVTTAEQPIVTPKPKDG